MAQLRKYHGDRPATNAERAKTYRANQKQLKSEADKDFKRRSDRHDLRWEIFRTATDDELANLAKVIAARLHPDKETGNEEESKRFNRIRDMYFKEDKRHVSGAEMPKAAEPPQPAIVTPSTVTDSETDREAEQQPQEQTTATCTACGRDVEIKDGRLEWHVNLGTFEDCTGGIDFQAMCRSIAVQVRK
jgi:hypothetical protein